MKILIVSDTHGYNETMWEVVKKEEPFDMMIHCGDIESDPQVIRAKIDCALFMVAGNNDYGNDLPQIKTFDIGKYRAVLVHGHRQHCYSDYSSLYYLGLENQADFVFFGHLHIPVIRREGPVTLINPGSLTYPRQSGRRPTYAVMTIEEGSEPKTEIRFC